MLLPPMTKNLADLRLSKRAVRLLGDLCFRKNDSAIPPLDCLLIFGSDTSAELCDTVETLFKQSKPKCIMIIGESPDDLEASSLKDGAENIYQSIKRLHPEQNELYLEAKSENLYENIHSGLKKLSESVYSLCYITKNFHAGRTHLILRHLLSGTKLFQRTYDPFYEKAKAALRLKDWYRHELFIPLIWTEFQKIKASLESKGFVPSRELMPLLNEIDHEISQEQSSLES